MANVSETALRTAPTASSTFGIGPEEIFSMLSPTDPAKYKELGGLDGMAKSLKADLQNGLNVPLTEDGKAVALAAKQASKSSVNATHGPIELASPTKSAAQTNLEERIAVFGTNKMPEPITKTLWAFVWDTFQDKMLLLLCFAAAAEIAIGSYKSAAKGDNIELIDGFAVLFAVVIVVVTTSVSDFNKQSKFKKLNEMSKSLLKSRVLRNGQMVQIHSSELLVGDICQIDTGDVIPADGVFIRGHNVAVDESSLTGEPIQILKDSVRDPFMLSGTKVLSGTGQMLIIATGVYSLNGRAILALEVEPERTPLQEKLGIIADRIAQFGITAACTMVVTLLIGFLAQADLGNSEAVGSVVLAIFISGITLIVVAVPEGLPLAVTLALAHATVKMLKDNNLVRHLKACETMGNATTICSDKTGTLTMNQMTVVRGLVSNQEFDRAGLESNKFRESFAQGSENMAKLLSFSCYNININSAASEEMTESGKIVFNGSKTDVALLNMTKQFGYPYKEDREKGTILEVYPFSSENKSMCTLIVPPSDMIPQNLRNASAPNFLFVKGAAEIISEACDRYLDPKGDVISLSPEVRKHIQATMLSFNDQALRTICVAMKCISATTAKSNESGETGVAKCGEISHLILVGLFGILDPLRKEVPDAVKTCQKAGVTVRMVTGDGVATARAIAKDCHILTEGGLLMEGHVFRKLTEEEMDKMVPKLQVLARSSPLDKQILVRHLKKLGETVAVTGDGTNDGPALKAADVGFSMGIAGTEVAKEASDIVLLDDNFASLVRAVIWGRSVYDAVRRFLQFQLTVNVSAVVLVFVTSMITLFTGDRIPVAGISAVQLLWVNLIMDTLAALALATDPPTPSLLNRKPSKRSDPILSHDMIKMILGQAIYQIAICLLVYLEGPKWHGPTNLAYKDLILLRSAIMFNTFVFCQIFNEVNSRSITKDLNIFEGIHKNPYFLSIIVITIVLQAIIVQFGSVVFHVPSGGLDWAQWLICIGLGAGTWPVGLIVRLLPDIPLPAFMTRPSDDVFEEEGEPESGDSKAKSIEGSGEHSKPPVTVSNNSSGKVVPVADEPPVSTSRPSLRDSRAGSRGSLLGGRTLSSGQLVSAVRGGRTNADNNIMT